MGMPDIRSLVPHAGPMVLLDRVISVDEDSLLAEVRIRSDSLFCNIDGVGAWVGIEYMAQAIGAWRGIPLSCAVNQSSLDLCLVRGAMTVVARFLY